MRWRALSLVLALCFASEARAEDASSRKTASQEFRRGVKLAKEGDLTAAVEAFESAYRTRPHHAVLYNLGQAYAGLDKPVEAARALEKYLQDGGDAIDAQRRREVEELVKRERGRIGYLAVTVVPPDADVFVDGARATPPAPDATLELAAGHHVIAARKEGYSSRVEARELRGGETVRVSLDLTTNGALPNLQNGVGQLAVACELPAVEVSVDGEPRGRTPFDAPLLVSPGTHAVRFARLGYRTVERSLAVREATAARVACPMSIDLRGTKPGRLRVTASEPFARVSVNGSPYDDAPLPPGPHVVRVERTGFRPWSRLVSVEPTGSHAVAAILEPTPDHVAELEAGERRQNHVAIAFGAAGIALLGTSAGLLVWNDGRYDEWQANAASPSSAVRAAELQRTDDIAAGVAILGAGALITAGVLWLTNGGADSHSHAPKGRNATPKSATAN